MGLARLCCPWLRTSVRRQAPVVSPRLISADGEPFPQSFGSGGTSHECALDVPAEIRAGRLVEARPESRSGPTGCGTWTFRTGRGARMPHAAGPGRGTKRPERLEPKRIEDGTPSALNDPFHL